MNKFEKVALEFLGEKEKERIVGGLKETDDLSSEQCEKLKQAVSNLSEEEQTQISAGCKQKGQPNQKSSKQFHLERFGPPAIKYGGPQPRVSLNPRRTHPTK